ncbi:MAG: tRNA lysidine(34) synthetase TilS [Clostridia bacterium]|nr:tRNA lysidine(34) synthetase TilS [Clostridia bacterium]
MICKVIDTVEKYRLLEGVKSVAVGVSGGADSMCLLHILSSLKDKYPIILKAVHINHNIRGNEALRDEKLVRDYCLEKGIELTVHSVDVPALAEKLGIGTEECGRKVRYECFSEAGCDAVATAHSLSDSVETVVYNLLRGTGTKGLCGIPVRREPNIIRPLISCTAEEIRAYCEKEHIPFATDSTNLTDDYARNYIRHNIIPFFEKVNASCVINISRACAVLSEDNDFIEKTALKLISEAERESGYDIEALNSAHPSVRKRALLILLSQRMNKQPQYVHIDLVNSVTESGSGKVNVSSDMYVKASDGILYLGSEEIKASSWQTSFDFGKAVSPYGVYSIFPDANSSYEGAFDGEMVCGELTLTSRREGDRFVFKSRGVSKSLKKLFNEMKIPVSEREKRAVLRDGEKIIWVEGVGVNASYIPDENSKKIYVIKKDD